VLRARESLAVSAFARFVREQPPDLILINGEMHAHIITASAAGARVALLNSFVSIWRHPGVPPPHTLARPGAGWSGTRTGAALLWQVLRLRKMCRRWSERVRRIGCDRVSVYRDLARSVGFSFERDTDARQWLMPFTYRHLPVLSLHAQEFEFAHQHPRTCASSAPWCSRHATTSRTPRRTRIGSRPSSRGGATPARTAG
jgi:hypothetical protein